MPSYIGRILIALGIVLIVAGLVLLCTDKLPFPGRLPGDIYIKKERFSFYFPVTTSIVISVILTIIFWLFRK